MSKQSLEEAVKLHNTLAYNLKVSVLSIHHDLTVDKRLDLAWTYETLY